MSTFHAVIPAGGSGTRLWPLSREGRPKFLLPILGPRTMLQMTADRLRPMCVAGDIMIVTGRHHAADVYRQLVDDDGDQVLVEPSQKGSGPAIGLATAIICERDPEAIVGSFAADHYVTDLLLFRSAVRAAAHAAERGYLVTIGVQPTYPETGYGYIRPGSSIGALDGFDVLAVDAFQEKPDQSTATSYVQSGGYLWNTSMFVWKARTLMDEIRRYLPELHTALTTIAAAAGTARFQQTLEDVWPSIDEVTIDHGILERSDRIAVVPATFGWADVGTWHNLGEIVARDAVVPSILGAGTISIDSGNTLVAGTGDRKIIALVGVNDAIVVDTDDALLICARDRAQDVRLVVEELKRRGLSSAV